MGRADLGYFLLCAPGAGRCVGIKDKVTPGFFLTENQTFKAPRPGQVFTAFIFSHPMERGHSCLLSVCMLSQERSQTASLSSFQTSSVGLRCHNSHHTPLQFRKPWLGNKCSPEGWWQEARGSSQSQEPCTHIYTL